MTKNNFLNQISPAPNQVFVIEPEKGIVFSWFANHYTILSDFAVLEGDRISIYSFICNWNKTWHIMIQFQMNIWRQWCLIMAGRAAREVGWLGSSLHTLNRWENEKCHLLMGQTNIFDLKKLEEAPNVSMIFLQNPCTYLYPWKPWELIKTLLKMWDSKIARTDSKSWTLNKGYVTEIVRAR